MHGFDEAWDGERRKHVACAREEEREFGCVYPEEAWFEVGCCGGSNDGYIPHLLVFF